MQLQQGPRLPAYGIFQHLNPLKDAHQMCYIHDTYSVIMPAAMQPMQLSAACAVYHSCSVSLRPLPLPLPLPASITSHNKAMLRDRAGES